jgi:hypothetical protein
LRSKNRNEQIAVAISLTELGYPAEPQLVQRWDGGFALGGVEGAAALIVHLNDAHHWTRERIAAWVADPDVPQDESHAHH